MANASDSASVSVDQGHSPWWKLQSIFFQPRAAFEAINLRADWIVPLILLIVMAIATTIVMDSKIGFEQIAMKQMELQGSSPEQIEQAQAGIGFIKIFAYVAAVLGSLVIALVTAAFLLLGFYMTGADVSFKKTLSVVMYSLFAYSLIVTILSVTIIMIASDPSELDVANLVTSNLGTMVDKAQSPVLASLLSSVDVLSFYYLFLLSLGMAITTRKSFATGLAVVILIWAVYLAVKVGWIALMPKPGGA